MTDTIEGAVRRALPAFTRSPDLEGDRNALCYENRDSQRLLRFEIGRPKRHFWLIAFRYESRPNLARLLSRGTEVEGLLSAEVGPLPLVTAEDNSRASRIVEHYAAHEDLIDYSDPFLDRFLDALPLDPSDENLAKETLRAQVSSAVLDLRGDVAKSELPLPIGTVLVERDAGYVATSGKVPAFSRLALDESRVGSALGWFKVDTVSFAPGIYVSRHTRELLAKALFEQARRTVDAGESWHLARSPVGDGREVLLVRSGTLQLRPSREYVLLLNRDRPEFIAFLEGVGRDNWREIYEHRVTKENAQRVLEAELARRPDDLEAYKRLAEYHAGQSDNARANLLLGLGYLRAKNLPSIARSKLELAARFDPNCPGLAEALAELAGFAKEP